jgi:pSer/pThr/pTyr-binding forkhead associated (FHA) protein
MTQAVKTIMDDQNTSKKPQTSLLPSKDRGETFIMTGNNPLLRKLMEKSSSEGDDTLATQRRLFLVVRGIPEEITLEEGQMVTVGRIDLTTGFRPGVDLTPYDAQKRGVSREHIRLQLKNQHVFVTDLGSSNGTILAGKRLTPQEPIMLHNGDELLLGGLAVKILFE